MSSNRPSSSAPLWEPLVYFWDGGWIGVGESRGTVPPHAHHAIQIAIGLNGPLKFRREDGEWEEMDAGVVLPDAPHGFDGCESIVAMIFIDPESREGQWLRDSLSDPITAIDRQRFSGHLSQLRDFRQDRPDPVTAAHIITGIVHALCAGPPPLRQMDGRIRKALDTIREQDIRRIPVEEAARSVFLSPSRFAHLFKEEVGLPFRRYLLWRKLTRAIEEFGRGSNLSEAAHAAGFSDSAHLTHTWRQMFGVPPTVMLGKARFYEIPAPFELIQADEER